MLVIVLLVSGCDLVKSPDEKAAEFWQAVKDKEIEQARSLTKGNDFKGFDLSNVNMVELNIGNASIHSNKAEVATKYIYLENGLKKNTDFTTHLTQMDGVWVVEFEKTINSLAGFEVFSMLEGLSGSLEEVGEEIGRQTGEVIKEAVEVMASSMAEGMQDLSEEIVIEMNKSE